MSASGMGAASTSSVRGPTVCRSLSQEIEARVVGDAKQPALEIIHPGAPGSRVKGLDEGILQYILAIDRRSRHARAVTMKAGPKRFQTILEFVRVHVSRPTALPRSVPPRIGHKCR